MTVVTRKSPGASYNKLMGIFKRHPNESYQPSSGTYAKKLLALREAMCGDGFEQVDVGEQVGYTGGALILMVRRSPVADFLTHAGKPSSSGDNTFALRHTLVVNDAGERVYGESCTGDRWASVERSVATEFNESDPNVCFWVAWADKVGYDGRGRQIGHPLTFTCGERGFPTSSCMPCVA